MNVYFILWIISNNDIYMIEPIFFEFFDRGKKLALVLTF